MTSKDDMKTTYQELEWSWHMRYYHLNFRSLIELSSNNLVYFLPKLNANILTCETYLRGKQRRMVFTSNMPKRSNYALEVVHYDICGPFEVSSLGGSKYFITFLMNLKEFYGFIP